MSSTSEDDYTQAREYLRGIFENANYQTCLSVLSHNLQDVRDLRCHFFGCLGDEERVQVLNDKDHQIWKDISEMERSDVGGTAASVETETSLSASSARYISALNLQAKLKRIAVLRRTPALKGSVRDVRHSIERWVSENKKGIQDIHNRRSNAHIFGEEKNRGQAPFRSKSEFPEREDILPEFSEKLREIVEAERDKKYSPEPDKALNASEYDLERDIRARSIKLKRPKRVDMPSSANSWMANVMVGEDEPIHDEVFKGTFPDQQVSVYWLLKKFREVNKAGLQLEERMCPGGCGTFTFRPTI